MGKFLQTNGKLKNSSVMSYAFNLPAIGTCPGAGDCKQFCFAFSEQKRYPSAMAHRARSWALSKSIDFISVINAELKELTKRHGIGGFAVRVHASGDFYSPRYARDWARIARANPLVQFYAYTKSIHIVRGVDWPTNFCLILSLGGRHDTVIDLNTDRHAKIFQTEAEAIAAGYALASEDDTVAWQSDNHKIGLVIFGATKVFKNLTDKVA